MTSARQRTANRVNARQSTGPKTEEGRARAAGNARTHGLTGALDPGVVCAWYRVILDDPRATPEPFEPDPVLRAARELAEAEAQLARVRRADEQYWRDPEGEPSEAEDCSEERQMILDALDDAEEERARPAREREYFFRSGREYLAWRRRGAGLLLRLREADRRATRKRLAARARRGRMLTRYRASAEARRHKALRRWISLRIGL